MKRKLKQVKMTFHTRDLVLIEEALKRYSEVLTDHYHAVMEQADIMEKDQLPEIANWIRKSTSRIQEQLHRVSKLQKSIFYGVYPGALLVEEGETEIPPQYDPKQFEWEELGEDQDYYEVMYPEWKREKRGPWFAGKSKNTPQTLQEKMKEIRQWGNELERHIRQIQADRLRLMMDGYPEPKQKLVSRMKAYYDGLKELLEYWDPSQEDDVEHDEGSPDSSNLSCITSKPVGTLLDHVMFTTRDVNLLEKELEIRFEPSIEESPNAPGRTARLGQGRLVVVTGPRVEERIFSVVLEVREGLQEFLKEASKRGIHFTGPVEQKVPVGNGRFHCYRNAFLGFDMPWLVEYEQPEKGCGEWQLESVEIGVFGLEKMKDRYIRAYNPREVSDLEDGAIRLGLDRGHLILHESSDVGFRVVHVTNGAKKVRIFADPSGWRVEQE